MQSTDQVKIRYNAKRKRIFFLINYSTFFYSDFGLSRRIDADVYMQKSDSKIPVKWYEFVFSDIFLYINIFL